MTDFFLNILPAPYNNFLLIIKLYTIEYIYHYSYIPNVKDIKLPKIRSYTTISPYQHRHLNMQQMSFKYITIHITLGYEQIFFFP